MRVIPPEQPTADLEDLPEVLPAEDSVDEVVPADRHAPARRRPGPGPKADPLPVRLATGVLRHYLAKFLVLFLFAPCGGVALILIQVEQALPYLGSGPDPQVISCQDLLARGPGANHYVELTDFRLESDRRTTDSFFAGDSWQKAWVPIVPADADGERQPVRLLLETQEAHTPGALDRLEQKGRIRGMVYRDIESLHITDILRVKGNYPDTDWPNSWLLRQGQRPPSPWITYSLIGLGVLLILAGLPIWWFAWQVWKAVRAR
jgi:hypothetical protein